MFECCFGDKNVQTPDPNLCRLGDCSESRLTFGCRLKLKNPNLPRLGDYGIPNASLVG